MENSKRDIVRSIFLGLGAGQKSSDMHDTIYKYKRKEREMTKIGQVLGRPNNSSIFFLTAFWLTLGTDRTGFDTCLSLISRNLINLTELGGIDREPAPVFRIIPMSKDIKSANSTPTSGPKN